MKLTTIKSLVAAALCAVGLSSFAAEPEAVQLWEGGPYFSTCNIGADTPEDYGILTNYNDAAQVVTDALGEGWRLPSDAELKILAGKNYGDKVCSNVWTTCNGVAGRRFFGMTSGYEDKSIFLPAAGYDYSDGRKYAGDRGRYWSSEVSDDSDGLALSLNFTEDNADVSNRGRNYGLSVRAVRDTPLVTGPTVKVASVETGDPWSMITVNYTLGGTDSKTDYKVAFDVTAGGVTKGVTNAAAKVENGATNAVIDTAALFGAATPDTKAKVKVSLIAIKPKEAGVQLWEDGPYWAESNLGTSEVQGHPEYGALYNFADAATEVAKLGGDWRLPTKGELEKLANASYCTKEWDSVNKGYTFTGATEGYKDKSIFLPAAGYDDGNGRTDAGDEGLYWPSEVRSDSSAWLLYFYERAAYVGYDKRSYGLSVRAVRASGEGGSWLGPDEIVVASGEKEFALTAFRELPENPTAEDVQAAIEASGAKDKNRILALIGGAADPVAAYQEFVAWAQGVGDVAVLNSDHAGDSFAFGVEELFEHEPEVQISDVAVASGAPGAMAISVTVKDGDSPKRVASEKVAQMFEATTDVADWTKGQIEPNVTDRTKDLATPVEFTVTPGDGTSEKAFLRIRK